jgi:hypothetical protein
MGTSRAGGSQDAIKGRRRRPRARRGVVLLVGIAAAVSQLQGAQAQTFPPPVSFQAAICQVLLNVQASFGTNPFFGQALAPFVAAFGCTGPATTIPPLTTTSIHLDCPLPGGGIGPCPSTTIVLPPPPFPTTTFLPPFPPTTFPPPPFPTTSFPPPFPTTSFPPGTFVPTTFPPGSSTSSTISTLPPCPSTTTTSPSIPSTTIPCQPAP